MKTPWQSELFARAAVLGGGLVLLLGWMGEARAEAFASFRTDILPVLTKAGCNSGSCHGAATGQGGFKLSLLGYDPELDHARITRELGGRRLNFDDARESLFLLKPTRRLEHEGGRRIARDSEAYRRLVQWIEDGARYGRRDLRVEQIRVEPSDQLVDHAGAEVALKVWATLSDGSESDVTALALYTSNDDAIAEVDKAGLVRLAGRGITSIMVRYGGAVACARLAVPLGDQPPDLSGFPMRNFIDVHVRSALNQLRIRPAALSADAEFLRRVFLDLTGCVPPLEVAREFLSRRAGPEERARLVDGLLASEAFVDYWTMKYGDWLLVGGKGSEASAVRAYHQWLRKRVAENDPLDRVVRDLLTARGDTVSVGPANFMMLASDPRDLSEHVGRMFLGARIGCARCHAHPTDRWTQEDYHRFAAYFARVTRDGGVVTLAERGEVDDPKTGRPVSPKPLGAPAIETEDGLDRRAALARWLTAGENRMFARAMVNRIWKALLGRGLVEPVDDLRPTNPASHPALLDALADEWVGNGFDTRWLIRTVVLSGTYQLSSNGVREPVEAERFYARAALKPLAAQVFADSVARVTGMPDSFEGYPLGTRAVQLVGTRTASPALDVLGRCLRERACEETGGRGGGVAAALHLINGSTINGKLKGTVIGRLLDEKAVDAVIVGELYERALARLPREVELAEWTAVLARAPDRGEAVEDLLWVLLNSREFAFNH